jgi:hypothetical protein
MKKLILLAFISSVLCSQTKFIQASKASGPIVVDGQIEDLWNSVPKNNAFKQQEPNPLQAATKDTEFKVSYDTENIYFLIKAYDDPESIVTQNGRRDNAFWDGDWVLIYIDPLNDKSSGYRFGVNPSNVQHDARLYNDDNNDNSWDAVWYSDTQVTSDGWTAEIRIPLRAIKFQSSENQEWGLNVERYLKSLNENSYWQEVNPDDGFKVSKMGVITGLEGLKTANEINILPSLVGTFDSKADYEVGRSDRVLGADIRFNLDEQHSILATIKPDFAQIEVDQDQVNLSDYPLYLEEKRPFFLEGNSLYNMPDEIYYSRVMTKPDYGFKVFGNQSSFKYGLMYVHNDGEDGKGNYILPRVKFEPNNQFQLGYFGGLVANQFNSDDKTSGSSEFNQIHAFDLRYRPNTNHRIIAMAATTIIENVNEENSSLRLQYQYNTDTYNVYTKIQKKTENFNQGLVGFPEPNNRTEANVSLNRHLRFEESVLRRINFNYNWNHSGTFDNQAQRDNMNVNFNIHFQTKKYGFFAFGAGRWASTGYFRNYFDDDEITNLSLEEQNKLHSDNYGKFKGISDNIDGYWIWGETDFSKPIALALNYNADANKRSPTEYINLTLQVKPNNNIKARFRLDYIDVEGSEYIDRGIFRTFSLKTEYSPTSDIYLKLYHQYNTSSERLTNNVILTYEYIRGSFIYFAYTETGTFEDRKEFNNGTLFETYDLGRRTISLKWVYSLYL